MDRGENFGMDTAMKHPRTRMVNFRVTPEEYERMLGLANAAECSVSDWVRTQIVLQREQTGMEDRVSVLEQAVERILARRVA